MIADLILNTAAKFCKLFANWSMSARHINALKTLTMKGAPLTQPWFMATVILYSTTAIYLR